MRIWGSVMRNHRTTILLAVLLGLVGVYVYQTQSPLTMPGHVVAKKEEPLDGNNEVRIVAVKPDKRGSSYTVEVEYRFRGDFRSGYLRA